MSLVRLYCTKREDLKGRVVMGIIIDPVTCPTPKIVLSRIDVLNPRARKCWNAPLEKFETLNYYGLLCRNDVCMTIWLLQLVKQVQLLSSSAPPHEDILTVQFPVGGNLTSMPNSLGMRLVGQTQCKIYIDA